MQVRIDDIKEGSLDFRFDEPADRFPALDDLESQEVCRFVEPVLAEGRVRFASGLLEVEGTVRTAVRQACGRCVNDFVAALKIPFAVTFSRETLAVGSEDEEEEVELTAEELGLIPFSGEEVDLREVVQEQIVLALPVQPLCRPDCAGLCPHCGADLNAGDCCCEAPAFNNRFAALRNLRIDDDSDGGRD